MSAPSTGTETESTGTPAGLPDLSKLPEEERDAAWLKHYYAGDKPQLTVRAVVVGGILGAALAVSNLYTTLKLGWAFGVAITACVLSWFVWNKVLVPLRISKSEMTLLENNCMQSTASAAGYSTGGTLATAVGALLLMTGDGQRMGWFPVACWVGLTALLGVFLAIPMKRQMINSEQLPFPSGIAAAETLRSLYAEGTESIKKARALIGSLFVGIVSALLRSFGYISEQLFFPMRMFTARGTAFTGQSLGMWFEPSLLLIAAGMIVGIRVSTWMFVGSSVNYLALAPMATALEDWQEPGKQFFGHMEATVMPPVGFDLGSGELSADAGAGLAASLHARMEGSPAITGFTVVGHADSAQHGTLELARARGEAAREALLANGFTAQQVHVGEPVVSDGDGPSVVVTTVAPDDHLDARPVITGVRVTRWSLWLGTALLVASGLTSFALGYKTILRAIRNARAGRDKSAAADALADIEVPTSWLVIGGLPITLGLTLLCWFAFGIAPWLGLISVVLSFVLALVACRATGETDTTPIGAMGKITQFTYALLAPANSTVNLMTAGITAGAAGSSADLLTDLKSGYLLGANPRQQFLAQFAGVWFGVPAVVLAWYVLVPNQAALEAFNSPATTMWAAVAQALSSGVSTIPLSARWAIVAGGIVGIVLSLIEGLAPRKYKAFVPSSMGLGLAMVVPFANALSFFVGAVIAEIWSRAHKETFDRYMIAVASGAVAGESLAAAFYAILAAAGFAG
jgi:uncharacterized oligopeptide transporter (OPT) family protein